MIYVFIVVGFAEPQLPKGSVSSYFFSYLTNKVVCRTPNSCAFVGIWKSIGCGGVTNDTAEVRVVAQRSHNPCSALLDPATMGAIKKKKPRVASTSLG